MLKTTTTSQSVLISLGWDTKVLVPANKAGALINMLADCTFLSSEYISDMERSVYVRKDAPTDMLLGQFELATRADYDAYREALRIAKEAAGEQQ